jgi:hypothetical protein
MAKKKAMFSSAAWQQSYMLVGGGGLGGGGGPPPLIPPPPPPPPKGRQVLCYESHVNNAQLLKNVRFPTELCYGKEFKIFNLSSCITNGADEFYPPPPIKMSQKCPTPPDPPPPLVKVPDAHVWQQYFLSTYLYYYWAYIRTYGCTYYDNIPVHIHIIT